MNFIVPSSTYRYLQFCSLWSAKARETIKQLSGVEPSLFLQPPLISAANWQFKPYFVGRLLKKFSSGSMPLTSGRHGVRLHGFTEVGFRANRVNYAADFQRGVALLRQQIILADQLAQADKVNTDLYPSILTIHLGRSSGQPKPELEQITKILDSVIPLAQEKKVIINLENTWSERMSGEDLGADLENLSRIIYATRRSENFGVTFDLSHALISYSGDYAGIKKILEETKILPLINYLHLTAPGWRYKEKPFSAAGRHQSFFIQMISDLLCYQPDSHAGLKTFFNYKPEEKDKFLDLVDFLIKRSKVTEPRFNVINLELGLKVWGTEKGARVGDLGYTLELIKKKITNVQFPNDQSMSNDK